MSTDELLTTAQAAEKLGVTTRTIARMVERGALTPAAQAPGIRGARLFLAADIFEAQIRSM